MRLAHSKKKIKMISVREEISSLRRELNGVSPDDYYTNKGRVASSIRFRLSVLEAEAIQNELVEDIEEDDDFSE